MFNVLNDWKGGRYPCKIAWNLRSGVEEYQKQQKKRESNCICFNFFSGYKKIYYLWIDKHLTYSLCALMSSSSYDLLDGKEIKLKKY